MISRLDESEQFAPLDDGEGTQNPVAEERSFRLEPTAVKTLARRNLVDSPYLLLTVTAESPHGRKTGYSDKCLRSAQLSG
jgi:hypothetical protein